MACISMGLHLNHVIYGLFCRQEAELQIISPLLSIILTYTCAVLDTMKNNKTLQRFCGSLYITMDVSDSGSGAILAFGPSYKEVHPVAFCCAALAQLTGMVLTLLGE